jgi:hypothetical protein
MCFHVSSFLEVTDGLISEVIYRKSLLTDAPAAHVGFSLISIEIDAAKALIRDDFTSKDQRFADPFIATRRRYSRGLSYVSKAHIPRLAARAAASAASYCA